MNHRFLSLIFKGFLIHATTIILFTIYLISKGAGLVLKAIIEEGEGDIPEKMQQLALTEGALPIHLYTALFTRTTDGRLLTHRQLSRHLVSLWTTNNQMAIDLLERTVVST